MRKIWDIPGGVHPRENKSQSNSSPIVTIALPKEIILPLNQHIGAPARVTVGLGDLVLKGQKIADAEGIVSAPVHASTSGKIIAIEDRPITHPSGLTSLCIVIEPDGKDTWGPLDPCEDYTNLPKAALVEKIRMAGIAGMGGAGFPTAVKLQPKANQKIDTLILNGTECEPYITADDLLMRERADDIIAGAELLAFILGNPQILVGIEDNKPEAIAAMQKAAINKNIEIVVFPTKYPSGGEKQLIQIVTGKEVPSGALPAQIGIVVQNVGTALAAFRAVRFGEPLLSRITTVVGESLQKQGNVDVLIGTPISHLLTAFGYKPELNSRLIIGGPMMGFTVNDIQAPVVKTTNCVLAPSERELPQPALPRPCIRCGSCAEACPASLLPQQLFWYSQSENFDALEAYHLFDCIECGACSYVCPSDLPLVQYYRSSKGTIRQLKQEKEKSDRSRQRFEFRKERIAKAEAEKEAKRIARKEAAEKAKQQLADKPPAPASTGKASAAEPAAPDIDKLERAIASSRIRLESAQQKLVEAESNGEETARLETLRAKIKQAEQKLADALDRKTEFQQQTSAAENTHAQIVKKMQASPVEKIEKSLQSIAKRLETAEQKLSEAQASNSPTIDALRLGVEKLKEKYATAEEELADAQGTSARVHETPTESLSAADQAIAKAKAKAAQLANMTDDEKAAAQIASLQQRLEKAKERLAKAEQENSEHIDAFRSSVTKLEEKLAKEKDAVVTH